MRITRTFISSWVRSENELKVRAIKLAESLKSLQTRIDRAA